MSLVGVVDLPLRLKVVGIRVLETLASRTAPTMQFANALSRVRTHLSLSLSLSVTLSGMVTDGDDNDHDDNKDGNVYGADGRWRRW